MQNLQSTEMKTMQPIAVLLCLVAPLAFGAPTKAESAEKASDSGESANVTAKAEEFELEAKSADLVFLVDVTGSMGSYIAGVKEAINKIVESANKKETALRLAFIGYRDPFGGGSIPEMTDELEAENFAILWPTRSVKEFTEFVSEVAATGGGDGPEDVFGGLEKAGKIQWDPKSTKRVLFFIADATAHGEQFGGSGGFNGGDPLERDLAQLLGNIKEENVELVFGKVNSGTEKMLEEFSKVWGSEIKQFNIQSSSRPFVGGGRGRLGFAGSARSRASFAGDIEPDLTEDMSMPAPGAAGFAGAPESEIASKIATAVDSLLD